MQNNATGLFRGVLDFRVRIHYNLVVTASTSLPVLLRCIVRLVFTALMKLEDLTSGIRYLWNDRDLDTCGGAISCHLDASRTSTGCKLISPQV